ncbi:hypothetical protein U9M48_024209 [Paspalum notatum var. saurae]|uniref:Reverse transcriptase domain-containing protein n=1 Tax=Paspalum notatum var. saurae TaxID=547442 RepID=A0AAQ3TN78_PASNO
MEVKPTDVQRPIAKRPYRMAPIEQDEVKKNIDELLAKGYIRPSSSPWAFPVPLVEKKNTNEKRMCVDYRARMKLQLRTSILSPVSMTCLINSKVGLPSIEDPSLDIPKTAFTTKYGLYEYLVMSFGLTNAPCLLHASDE